MIVHEAAFSQTIPSRTMKNKIGLSIIVIGVMHTLLSLMKFSDTFSEIIKEGIINSGLGANRGWAIWFTVTGFVFIFLGLAIQALEQHQLTVPKLIGWGLLLTAVIGGLMIPLSGFWILLLPSLFIILAKWQ